VGEDPHGPVRLARALVSEHEGHPLLLHLNTLYVPLCLTISWWENTIPKRTQPLPENIFPTRDTLTQPFALVFLHFTIVLPFLH
jgi:hypothetical protein